MKIKLHGIRGSLPTPIGPEDLKNRLKETLNSFVTINKTTKMGPDEFLETLPVHARQGYGGNTACVEVEHEGTNVLIDTGTGIRNAMPGYMAGDCGKGKGTVDILMTHFHWDHILGLPFFVPIYMKGNTINFYAVQSDCEEVIKSLFKKPYFPVPFEALEATINFHVLKPRESNKIGNLDVTPYQLDHPDECWGFRIIGGGKVYSHCVDNEATRSSRRELGLDLPLYQGVDLMLFDAQYSFKEAEEKKNWGHASAPIGLEIAIREGIKRILFSHHDPFASDENISQIAKLAVKYFETGMDKSIENYVDWSIAIEGTVIDLLSSK